jgi:hypothetical protein
MSNASVKRREPTHCNSPNLRNFNLAHRVRMLSERRERQLFLACRPGKVQRIAGCKSGEITVKTTPVSLDPRVLRDSRIANGTGEVSKRRKDGKQQNIPKLRAFSDLAEGW